MMREAKVESRHGPDGVQVMIVKTQISGVAELGELIEHLPMFQPENSFLKKMRVLGRENGKRLQVMLVFQLYERLPHTVGHHQLRAP